MTTKELINLIRQGEGQFVEFKDARIKPSALAKSLVAFANTNAGRIIVGIDEKTRRPSGITNKEEVLDNIHRAASLDCCDPAVGISVVELICEGKVVFVVTVPYQYESVFSAEGKVLIRRGTENVTASSHEIIALSSRRAKLKYETTVIDETTLDDLEPEKLALYRKTYQERRGRVLSLPNTSLLENLGSISKVKGEYKPTVAGILIFGKFPQTFLPQSRVSIVRYPTDRVTRDILDSREIEGTLPDLIENALSYFSDRVQVASVRDIERFGSKRQDIPEYPLRALREIIINAIAHREYRIEGSRVLIKWFASRIEVMNPGDFVEPITPQNIYVSQPVHRNPNIMKTLYGYGYVEGYGDGMHIIREQFESHPLKPKIPKFEEIPGGVKVTIYAANLDRLKPTTLEELDLSAFELNQRQRKAVEFVVKNGQISRKEYVKINNVSERTAARDLADMIKKKVFVTNNKRGWALRYLLKR